MADDENSDTSGSGAWSEREEIASYLAEVRSYYDTTTGAYLSDYGTSLQVMIADTGEPGEPGELGELGEPGHPEEEQIFSRSNLYFGRRAGVKPGDHLLDAGCGVCGPSIDLARNIEGITIDAVTLSPVQAGIASRLVQEAGLRDRITVHVGDYHDLPFRGDTFDIAIFFESSGYSYDQPALFAGVSRVLKPGGRLYVKDVFREPGPLTQQQAHDLQEFDRIYRYRTAPITFTAEAIAGAGFVDVKTRYLGKHDGRRGDPGQRATGHHFYKAMTRQVAGGRVLTEFGKAHLYPFKDLPVYFGDITARKP